MIISLESVCVIPGNAAESTSKSENGYVVDEYERLATSLSNKTVGAVSFYDPRNSNIMTDIKDQETTDLCWLYSTTGMADTYVYKSMEASFPHLRHMAVWLCPMLFLKKILDIIIILPLLLEIMQRHCNT